MPPDTLTRDGFVTTTSSEGRTSTPRIWTMLPIRDGRSRSLSGQGLDARRRRFRVRG
jgi:hypothetical protein